MNKLPKMKEVSISEKGNYNPANDWKMPQLNRGSIEFALEVLRFQFKANPLRAVPYNKTFDINNYTNFNLNDVIYDGSSPSKYIFYGDVVLNCFDDELGVNKISAGAWVVDDLVNVLAGTRAVVYDIAQFGGSTNLRSSAVNNAFVSFLSFGKSSEETPTTAWATNIKLEGHLIQLYP